mgnify:CR=1 FL=1
MTEIEIRDRLITMIMDKVGAKRDEIANCTDIEKDLGCTGDDYFELMEDYAKEFNVDMSDFRWYFHTHDEAMATVAAIEGLSPSVQVERIPVSLEVLVEMVKLGRWSMAYPDHTLQPRYSTIDKVIQVILLTFIMVVILSAALRRC